MSSVVKRILIAVVIIVVTVGAISIGVAIYGWRAAVHVGNRQKAILNLKIISVQEIQYYSQKARSFGTFDQLVKEQMLDSRFAQNPIVVDGYVYNLTVTPRTAIARSTFTISADPQNGANDHFYLDDTNSDEIHVNPTKAAGPTDPLLNP